jgi:hypothetical protein
MPQCDLGVGGSFRHRLFVSDFSELYCDVHDILADLRLRAKTAEGS